MSLRDNCSAIGVICAKLDSATNATGCSAPRLGGETRRTSSSKASARSGFPWALQTMARAFFTSRDSRASEPARSLVTFAQVQEQGFGFRELLLREEKLCHGHRRGECIGMIGAASAHQSCLRGSKQTLGVGESAVVEINGPHGNHGVQRFGMRFTEKFAT